MKKYQSLLVLLLLQLATSYTFAQDKPHRRANYFETYMEIKLSIDSIVVFKEKREMFVFNNGKSLKKYIISLGEEPIGKKQFEGDMKTPEGLYYIDDRDSNSHYHKNLGINYPNTEDSTFAAAFGKSAGGEIKIHGFPNNHRKVQEREFLNTDWTIGCIAVSNFEVDELYKWVIDYCPILILP